MFNRLSRKVIILTIALFIPILIAAILLIPQWKSQAAADKPSAPPGQNQHDLSLSLKKPLVNISQTYTVSEIATLGGSSNAAQAISKNGQVTGYSWTTGDANNHAFRYTKGNLIDLSDLGGGYSSGYGINNSGWVVGESENATTDRAFLYTGAPMTDLGTFGGSYSVAWGINDHGQVVGEAELAGDLTVHAFVYTNTTMTDLGVLGTGQDSYAYAINDNGQVVGESRYDSSTNYHGFLDSNGVMKDLGSLGGNSSATAINDKGQVVGWSYLPSGKYVATISNNGNTMQQIGDASGGDTAANGINNRGQVVGYSLAGGRHAMLIDNGQTYNLNDMIPANSGWILTEAYAINDKGMIVGVGSHNGKRCAFILTPRVAWTLMYYEDSAGTLGPDILKDFNQLELAANNPNVNIVALWDPPGQNDSAYYAVQYDTNLNSLAHYTTNVDYFPQGELNMGDPNTLVNFVNWAKTKYPAEHYAIILDDHGSGLNGSMIDDQNQNDLLTVKEMGTALNTITGGGTNKIDVLEEYACLMGMVEDDYQIRNSVSYYVASENILWGDPKPFQTTISGIVSSTTPAQLAILAAKSYADFETARNNPYTFSAVDLSQVNVLTSTINSLAQVLNSRMVTVAITLTQIISPLVQRFDQNGDGIINLQDSYIDLYDFAHLAGTNYSDPVIQAAAQGVMDALSSYVIYEQHGSGIGLNSNTWILHYSHGVSIFFPGTKSSFYNGNNLDFAAGVSWLIPTQGSAANAAATADWGNMLANYMHTVNPSGADNPNPPPPIPSLIPPTELYLPMVER
jgi:probable HAF family extracellular repeat protein